MCSRQIVSLTQRLFPKNSLLVLLAPQIDSQGFLSLFCRPPSAISYMFGMTSAACVDILPSYIGATHLRVVFLSPCSLQY
ncbi:uncharacterized protein LACBIDRAFT_310367 [Laccaria bicolor S238N-H82]|uniref:Predicted protein n=1 Tax=Laccaria bicolor (strain S238N-H82 / ATCC MYA-4686) TaxID=486041 RepID=B0DU72_LACBS|nr:uncharacterized protein LACBIDRAFT_310367 [Laccaria bicolor S238N-H82]EDR01897.1 predicted protein [Laccaria bicolor S238N-H82]|eukprot:XP_001887507.1 predicted protein [Laccaria bicolor S238N-H82]